MKITKEAILLFYKIFFSCYIEEKINDKQNCKKLEELVAMGTDISFGGFSAKLKGWGAKAETVLILAKKIKKEIIDVEVISKYFGGVQHTKAMLEELKENNLSSDSPFGRYFSFNHMLIPVRVESVSKKMHSAVVKYENNNVLVLIGGIIFSEEDCEKIKPGKMVLCHYPMVVDSNPSSQLIADLLFLQGKDVVFMKAAKSFAGGLKQEKFPYFSIVRKRMPELKS